VRVGLVERLAGEAGGDEAGEAGAFEDVFVRAAQRVVDGLAGTLGAGDLVVEFAELALGELCSGSSWSSRHCGRTGNRSSRPRCSPTATTPS
jgi:hypothetical protein